MSDLSEFTSGADYDAQYGDQYEPEIAFLNEMVSRVGSPVLDLCCGTGIVTLPVAETAEVVGVDLSGPMLVRAKAKRGDSTNPQFVQANALTLELARQFKLVFMTGNAFQGFQGEAALRRLLQIVAAHLETGGHFVFDSRLTDGHDLRLDDAYRQWDGYATPDGRRVRFFVKQAAFDAEKKVFHYHMKREYEGGQVRTSSNSLTFLSLAELLSLLRESGLEPVEMFADWGRTPLSQDPAKGIFHCRKRG